MDPGGASAEQRSIVETAPVGPHPVALHHEFGAAFGGDRQPDRGTQKMRGNRDFIDRRTELFEELRTRHDLGIDVALRGGKSETFLDDSDAQSLDAAIERLRIA